MASVPRLESRFRRNPRVVHRSLGDGSGGVLLHLDTGAYHGVNATGELVWTTLEHDATLSSLLQEMRPHLAGAPDNLEDEVAAFLDELSRRDLVQKLSGAVGHDEA